MRCVAVMASDPRGVIGREGGLPWHFPEDLHFFQEMTLGKKMFMGFQTYAHLPKNLFRARSGCVLTQRYPSGTLLRPQVYSMDSLDAMLSALSSEVVLIGGGQLFQAFLDRGALAEVYLTLMEDNYEGDAFLPLVTLRALGVWECLMTCAAYKRYRIRLPLQ